MLDFLGELSLTLDKRVHPVGVFEHLRVAERVVQILIFPKEIHHFLHSFLNDFKHGLLRVHLRLLFKVAYRVAGSPYNFSLVGFLHSGNDFEQGGFSGTVETDDSDFRSVEEGKVNVL